MCASAMSVPGERCSFVRRTLIAEPAGDGNGEKPACSATTPAGGTSGAMTFAMRLHIPMPAYVAVPGVQSSAWRLKSVRFAPS